MSAAVNLPPEPAADKLSDAITRVERGEGRVLLIRDEEPMAALVPLDDLRALEELDEMEDAHWSRVAAEAIVQWKAEGCPPGISHEELLARHGIDPNAE